MADESWARGSSKGHGIRRLLGVEGVAHAGPGTTKELIFCSMSYMTSLWGLRFQGQGVLFMATQAHGVRDCLGVRGARLQPREH